MTGARLSGRLTWTRRWGCKEARSVQLSSRRRQWVSMLLTERVGEALGKGNSGMGFRVAPVLKLPALGLSFFHNVFAWSGQELCKAEGFGVQHDCPDSGRPGCSGPGP